MSSYPSISKNMFLAKRRARNWRRVGLKMHTDMKLMSLSGDYDAIDLSTTLNTRIAFIDPPVTKEKRIWLHNANPKEGNQHFIVSADGNIEITDGYTQIYPAQFIAFSWDRHAEIWRVIARPFRIDGGMAKYTGELGTTGLILNEDYTPLKWSDGKYITWSTKVLYNM